MNSRLGTSTRRQSVVLDLVDADPGDHREVAGDQRQHAGGDERDQAGGEGDRDVGSVDRVHGSAGRRPAGSVQRRGQATPVLAGELVIGAELGEDADHRLADQVAALGVVGLGDQLLQRLERGLEVARVPGGERRRAGAGRAPRRRWRGSAAPGPRGPGRESLPGAARAAPAPPLSRRGRAGSGPGRPPRRCARDRARAPRAATPRRRRPASSSAGDGTSASRKLSICAGGIAPVNSATTWPSRNAFTAGIPWTPKLAARLWLESTSTFASSTLPARLPTAASSAGPSWRHGPHHSAQKSTTTGSSRERSTTSATKSIRSRR